MDEMRPSYPFFRRLPHKSLLGSGAAVSAVIVMVTRYFFHLVDSQNVIRDDRGALATDLADAHRVAAEIIREFRIEQATRFDDWKDWRLVVMDESENFALIIPLAPNAQTPSSFH